MSFGFNVLFFYFLLYLRPLWIEVPSPFEAMGRSYPVLFDPTRYFGEGGRCYPVLFSTHFAMLLQGHWHRGARERIVAIVEALYLVGSVGRVFS